MRDALLLGTLALCLLLALRRPYVGVLVWAWFALMTPHQMAYGAYGVPLNAVIAGVTIVALILNGEYRRFRFDRTTALLLLLAFWLTISQVFSLDAKNSALYYDRFIKLLVFVLICVQTTTDKLRFHALVWMFVVSIGFFAMKGAAFTIVTLGQFHVQGPPNTVMEDNNHLGIIMATSLPMILYLRAEAANKLVRLGLLILFAATMLAILGTQSRGAFVSLIAFAGFFWLRSKHKLSIAAGLFLLLTPAIAFMPEKWSTRMETITSATEDASFMGRVDAWIINTKLAVKHPITGAGLRNSYQKEIAATVDRDRADHAKAAHSIYFELLGGAGFIGLAIYLSLLATAFFTALSFQRRSGDPALAAWAPRFGYFAQMSLVVFGVGGATVSLEMWDGYLLLVALIAALPTLAVADDASTARIKSPHRLRWRVAARGHAAQGPRPSLLER